MPKMLQKPILCAKQHIRRTNLKMQIMQSNLEPTPKTNRASTTN